MSDLVIIQTSLEDLIASIRQVVRDEMATIQPPVNNNDKGYLSRKDVAKQFGVTTKTISKMVRIGQIKAYRVAGGRRIRFRASEIEPVLKLIHTGLPNGNNNQVNKSTGLKYGVRS